MKKLLLALLLVCMLLPMAAYAGPPQFVQGDFTYVPLGCEVEKWANGNQFLLGCSDEGDWYQGDFDGESTEEYKVVLHGSDGGWPPLFESGFYKGTVTFTGTVAERTGTVVMLFVGTSPGGEGGIDNWSGTWRIISGTGDLANLHGQGVFWNNGTLDIHYEGRIQFAP